MLIEEKPTYTIPKLILVALLFWYSGYFLTARMITLGDNPGGMHLVHLVFHEAGHALLMWAPPVVMSLGGTLGQMVVPLVVLGSFVFKQRAAFSAAICGWWFGHSLVDIAPYINDARATRLMLLGGGTGDEIEGHDWQFILTEWGLLSYDIYIARVVLWLGRGIMVASLLASLGFALWTHWQTRREERAARGA